MGTAQALFRRGSRGLQITAVRSFTREEKTMLQATLVPRTTMTGLWLLHRCCDTISNWKHPVRSRCALALPRSPAPLLRRTPRHATLPAPSSVAPSPPAPNHTRPRHVPAVECSSPKPDSSSSRYAVQPAAFEGTHRQSPAPPVREAQSPPRPCTSIAPLTRL